MKTKSIFISFLLFSNLAFSQTNLESVRHAFVAYDSAKTYPQRMQAIGKFRLLASQTKDEWLINYYAAYALAVTSFEEQKEEKKDLMLNEADGYFNRIQSMADINDEINVLGALLAQARLAVNPGSRYKKYGDIRSTYLKKAKELRPENPRIYNLEGNSVYYTPKMFGGGPKKAQPYFEKAAELFAKEEKGNIIKPYWGESSNKEMLEKCKGD